jgi:hypothetical protein
MGVYRLSKRAVPQLMRDLFRSSMSAGAVVGCQQIASHALAAPYEGARAFVVEQPVKRADETGWWTICSSISIRHPSNYSRNSCGNTW